MNTKHQDSFYYGYTAIKSSIDSGEKTNSLIMQFNEQTISWEANTIIDYINYIKSQNYRGDAWGNGHEIFMDLKKALDLKLVLYKLNAPAPTPPLHITCLLTPIQLKQLYTGLTSCEFFPTDTTGLDYIAFCYIFGGNGNAKDFKPLEWIKTGSTTHGKIINKLSLLNLLELLNVPNIQIRDKKLLNKLFIKPDGTSIKFTGSNYTNTQKNFNSEYHNQLQQIVSTIK